MQIQKVVGSDILQGKDTQRFIAKWNSLKRLSGKSDCSLHPAYRLWLYEDKAKLSQCVAICFECHRIYLLEPSNSDHLGNGYLFEDSSAAHDMRKTLARLFPGHDPDAQ